MDDEGVAGAEQTHGLGDDRNEVRGVDAHDLRAGAGGIGERANQVEDGADAEGAAHRHDGLHGRVQGGGVQEGEAVGAQRRGTGSGGERDGDAEGFEDIGRTALRGDGAVAVLGDRCSGGRGDQRGGGGDVEGAREIGPGAAGVDQESPFGLVEGDGRGGGTHGVDEAGDLGGGFTAQGERTEQGGEQHGARAAGAVCGGVAGEDLFEQSAGIGAREGLAPLYDAVHVIMQGHEGKGIRRGRLRGNGFLRSRFETAGRHAAFAR